MHQITELKIHEAKTDRKEQANLDGRDFNISLSPSLSQQLIDTIHKVSKNREKLHNTIDQQNLNDILKTLHPTKVDYTFFSKCLQHIDQDSLYPRS